MPVARLIGALLAAMAAGLAGILLLFTGAIVGLVLLALGGLAGVCLLLALFVFAAGCLMGHPDTLYATFRYLLPGGLCLGAILVIIALWDHASAWVRPARGTPPAGRDAGFHEG